MGDRDWAGQEGGGGDWHLIQNRKGDMARRLGWGMGWAEGEGEGGGG